MISGYWSFERHLLEPLMCTRKSFAIVTFREKSDELFRCDINIRNLVFFSDPNELLEVKWLMLLHALEIR
jgi:hypothetical protein